MTKYVGAIDSGTTSTRFILFDQSGSVVASDQREHEQIFPQSGWVEHDPLEIWNATQTVIRAALEAADVKPGEISAIGVTNQRETTVVWDRKTGRPIYNAIVWQDVRTDLACEEMTTAGHSALVRAQTGLPIATYFSATKIRWILDQSQSNTTASNLLFGNIDSWLVWLLTGGKEGGVHVTDPTNASRTMLMNIETLRWDPELLDLFSIPEEMLPTILPSSQPQAYGMTQIDGPFGEEIPITGILGDQQAATVGQTCFRPGEAKNTYGTGCFMILNTGTELVRSQHGLLTTVCYQFSDQPPVYALEGSVNMAGATVQWLRDNLGLIETAEETEEIAMSVDDSGGCYFVPAFSGLFAPYWRSDARGAIVGLTRYVNRAHIVRAALESICYQTREVMEAMVADSGVKLDVLKVDGGATSNDFLMQLQSDIMNCRVVRPEVTETTSLGAAYAAGLAVGFWRDLDSLRSNWQISKSWESQTGDAVREAGFSRWKRAVERTFDWADK